MRVIGLLEPVSRIREPSPATIFDDFDNLASFGSCVDSLVRGVGLEPSMTRRHFKCFNIATQSFLRSNPLFFVGGASACRVRCLAGDEKHEWRGKCPHCGKMLSEEVSEEESSVKEAKVVCPHCGGHKVWLY